MKEKMTAETDEFARALIEGAADFNVRLTPDQIARLRKYHQLLTVWNARLHLTGPCSPAEFATRHVLESLFASEHLPAGARVADVGSGAGLPIIPCLIARSDLSAKLIEASRKKAIFLREALRATRIEKAEVIAERFESLPTPEVDVITCRALERFGEMLPQLIAWAPPGSTLLLFGGPELSARLSALGIEHEAVPLPRAKRRLLLVARR